ncbi:MAG TPA: two-component system response regulator [Syntrophus sp. (in: bacteria)]|nr:two-component system response regulator [Syntrophus sp. (in: bacteria)]
MNRLDVIDILLVEDNPQDAELTIRGLRRRNINNPLHVVEDGAEALDFIFCRGAHGGRDFSKLPKLILLDLKLPKMDGLEVLKALKLDERTRAIPVAVVSSSQETPDIQTAYALGANSYVVKPAGFDAFLEAVGNLGFYWLLVNQPPVK